jgi:hypothetical protein
MNSGDTPLDQSTIEAASVAIGTAQGAKQSVPEMPEDTDTINAEVAALESMGEYSAQFDALNTAKMNLHNSISQMKQVTNPTAVRDPAHQRACEHYGRRGSDIKTMIPTGTSVRPAAIRLASTLLPIWWISPGFIFPTDTAALLVLVQMEAERSRSTRTQAMQTSAMITCLYLMARSSPRALMMSWARA